MLSQIRERNKWMEDQEGGGGDGCSGFILTRAVVLPAEAGDEGRG